MSATTTMRIHKYVLLTISLAVIGVCYPQSSGEIPIDHTNRRAGKFADMIRGVGYIVSISDAVPTLRIDPAVSDVPELNEENFRDFVFRTSVVADGLARVASLRRKLLRKKGYDINNPDNQTPEPPISADPHVSSIENDEARFAVAAIELARANSAHGSPAGYKAAVIWLRSITVDSDYKALANACADKIVSEHPEATKDSDNWTDLDLYRWAKAKDGPYSNPKLEKEARDRRQNGTRVRK